MYPANRNERFSEHATAEHSIGTVLVSMQMVTRKQLEEALEVQKTEKRGVGKILVSLGHLTSDGLARALSTCSGLPYVAPSELRADPDVLGS